MRVFLLKNKFFIKFYEKIFNFPNLKTRYKIDF